MSGTPDTLLPQSTADQDFSVLTLDQLRDVSLRQSDIGFLKNLARWLGIEFAGNIGAPLLRTRISARLTEMEQEEKARRDEEVREYRTGYSVLAGTPVDPVAAALAEQNRFLEQQAQTNRTFSELTREHTHEELLAMDSSRLTDDLLKTRVIQAQALRLRRVRVTNLDPSESEIPGAIITVVNSYTGKVSKYVPYTDEAQVNGYHIPQIIYDDLKSRTYAVVKSVRTSKSGETIEYRPTQVPKYTIEDLPPLTEKELRELGVSQQTRGAIDSAA